MRLNLNLRFADSPPQNEFSHSASVKKRAFSLIGRANPKFTRRSDTNRKNKIS